LPGLWTWQGGGGGLIFDGINGIISRLTEFGKMFWKGEERWLALMRLVDLRFLIFVRRGIGLSTAARVILLRKNVLWLAFAQDDGISKIK
jgi:hypothetical protein